MELLVEALEHATEVVELDMGEEHALEENIQVGHVGVGTLPTRLRGLGPELKDGFAGRLAVRVDSDHAANRW